jgi:glycine oxidase
MGLGIARALALSGEKVTLLEKGPRGGDGASRAAAGMIGPQSEAMEDDGYFAASLAGRDLWPAYAAGLGADAIGFRAGGALHVAFGASYELRLESKYLWQKRRAGRVDRLEGDELFRRFPMLPPRVSCGYFAHGDYVVDNEALCDALQAACVKAGVDLKFNSEVLGLDQAGAGWSAKTAAGTFSADQAVLATGAWAGTLAPGHGIPVKGQMLSFKVPPELQPSVPLHAEDIYLVPRGDGRLLVGATVEHVGFDTRVTGEGVEWLLKGAFETIPDLRGCEVDRLWAGLRPGSADGWPSLGPADKPGLHLALGAFRRGILFLPLVVETVVAGVLGKPMPAEALVFRPRVAA